MIVYCQLSKIPSKPQILLYPIARVKGSEGLGQVGPKQQVLITRLGIYLFYLFILFIYLLIYLFLCCGYAVRITQQTTDSNHTLSIAGNLL